MFLDIFVHIPKCAGGTIQEHIEHQYSGEERFGPHNPYYKEKISRILNKADQKLCQTDSTLVRRSWIHAYLSSLDPDQRNSIHSIYGHAAYYGIHELFDHQPRYFTFLREPLARFISLYNYILTVRVTPERLVKNEIQKNDGSLRSLDEWLEEANLNLYSISSFLVHTHHAENLLQSYPVPDQKDMEDIKKMLASFYFVGLTENKEDMEFTFKQLAINSRLPNRNVLNTKETYLKPASLKKAQEIVAERCPFDIELYEYAVQLNHEKKMQLPEYKTTML